MTKSNTKFAHEKAFLEEIAHSIFKKIAYFLLFEGIIGLL